MLAIGFSNHSLIKILILILIISNSLMLHVSRISKDMPTILVQQTNQQDLINPMGLECCIMAGISEHLSSRSYRVRLRKWE